MPRAALDVLVAVAMLAACDRPQRCGPGTVERDGVCVSEPTQQPPVSRTGDQPDGGSSDGIVKLVPITIVSAIASSELGAHLAMHAVDRNVTTARNASAPSGAGQWIELQLAATVPVRQVELRGGYWGRSQRTGESLLIGEREPVPPAVSVGAAR